MPSDSSVKEVAPVNKKAGMTVKWLLPVLLILWYPARFYWDIMQYHTHFEDLPSLFFELAGFILCTAGIIRAIKRHDWAYAALVGTALVSCVFFGYWTNRIPFCVECDRITREDLGFMLKPFADRFGYMP